VDPVRSEVLEALRAYAVTYRQSGLDLARWMSLPTSDGLALGEILWAEREDEPLSPVRLSERIGMTSGATNALLNRLEAAGHVARSREHDDRRLVTLRATRAARERATAFYGRQAAELHDALASYDDAELARVRDFLVRFAAILPRADPATVGKNE